MSIQRVRISTRGSRGGPATGLLLALVLLAPALLAAPVIHATGTSTSTRPVKQPPYYRGKIPQGSVARLPVVLAPLPAGLPEEWLPVAALERLAADLEQRLSRTLPAPLLSVGGGGGPVVAPTVYLGCSLDLTDECSEEERVNVLSVTGGTAEWRRLVNRAAAETGSGRVLAVELAIAPQWIAQRGLKGKKEVRLGTGHVQPLAWLTSLDTPVWVLQVTGVVVAPDGKVARSGAEGIWALRTPFRASALGAQKLMTEEDVEQVREAQRRPDLPGQPRVWEAALDQLVAQLLGPAAS